MGSSRRQARTAEARTFGKNLARLREARGLSREDLAELTGVPPEAIGSYERGENVPRSRRQILLAEAMGVSIVELTANETQELYVTAQASQEFAEAASQMDGPPTPLSIDTLFESVTAAHAAVGALIGKIGRDMHVLLDGGRT